MARLGYSKSQSQFNKNAKNRSQLVLNKEGAPAYKFTDEAELLIATVASYMAEPGFYPDKTAKRHTDYNSACLDERGRDIFEAAIELCKKGGGEDVLRIANWARNEANMRLVPQLLLCASAQFIRMPMGHVNPVRRYVNVICRRPDDCIQVLALMSALFGQASTQHGYSRIKLPNALKEGLAMTLSNFSVYQILKYNNTRHRPNLSDLLGVLKGMDKVVRRSYVKGRGGFPLQRNLHKYLSTGQISVESPPEIKARADFFKLNPSNPLNEEVDTLMRIAGLTWENLVSHFGATATTPQRKRQLWTKAASIMPYMASLRNLRNFVEANIDCKPVASKIANKSAVAKSRQLPFRFYSAYNALKQCNQNSAQKRLLLSALEKALEYSIENLAELPGVTAIFADNSGSMGCSISAKSKLTAMEVANLLCALVAKKSANSKVAVFATDVKFVNANPKLPVIQLANQIRRVGSTVGHGTNFADCITTLIRKRINVDRIIVLTDMQSYGSQYGTGSVKNELQKYHKKINSNTYFHTVNLQAHSAAMTTPGPKVQCVSGFSEKIITQIARFEQPDTAEQTLIPGLADIRKNFSLSVALPPKKRA